MVWTTLRLIRASAQGLLDMALPAAERAVIAGVLAA
jgi:hypothetical protein